MTFESYSANQRVVSYMKKRFAIGIPLYILLALIVVFAGNLYARHLVLSIFFPVSLAGVGLIHLIHRAVWPEKGSRYEALSTYIFFAQMMATAMIWGMMYAWVMSNKNIDNAQSLMTVCVCGLCAAGATDFVPVRRISILYSFLLLMPAAVTSVLIGKNIYPTIMLLVYFAYMTFITVGGYREYWNALRNEYLLEIKSRELERLSNTDALTGLYNRRYFNEALDREWKMGGRNGGLLSAILLDIDQFKNINDAFGHQAGDEYLKRTAAVLTSVFRREHDIVARYGGEEFIALLPGVDAENARRLAEKARRDIASTTLDYQGKAVRTTISAGIVCCMPDFKVKADVMIVGADQALYEAKNGGRDRVVLIAIPSCLPADADDLPAK